MTTEERSAHWHGIIDKQTASGRRTAAYCREEHIHGGRFYFWRRRFNEGQPTTHGFLEVITGGAAGSSSGICIQVGENLFIPLSAKTIPSEPLRKAID